jgi:imidazolonepropionase-like amidohydrolase
VVARDSRALTALRCANNGALQLGAGVTTVRDVGATDGLSIDVAQAVGLGVLAGPRVVAAGRAIAMIGGHGWFLGREADGPDAVRRAVREEMKAGATCIKLMASGGVYGHAEEPGSPQLTVEEMSVAVEEAHKAGRKAAAHAYSAEAINNALSAGVDSIEHGSFLDRQTAERMREQGTYLVPTMSVYASMDRKVLRSVRPNTSGAKPPRYSRLPGRPSGSRWRPACPSRPAPTAAHPATRTARWAKSWR